MYAKYIKQEIADLNGTGRTQACYKMELSPMSYKKFVEMCSREGGMDVSAIVGVLTLVSKELALYMAEGRSLKLDGIGTFNAKLGVRDDMQPDGFEEGESSRNSKSIIVNGVAFRADKDLIRNTNRKCTLEKGGESRLRKSPLTLEQRIEKAREFLKRNIFMRVPDYVRLTGLSRSTAAEELRKVALNPASGIMSRGNRSQKIYILRPEAPQQG